MFYDAQVILHRHLLRTTATTIVDIVLLNLVAHICHSITGLFFIVLNGLNIYEEMYWRPYTIFPPMQDMYTKLNNGIEVEESQNPESVLLSSGERIALVWAAI